MSVRASYDAYDVDDKVVYMSLDEALELSRELARDITKSDFRPDLVVGLANGAIFTTIVVSDELGAPFQLVKVRRRSSRIKQRLQTIRDLARLPPELLRWKPLNELHKAFNRRFNQIESQTLKFDVSGKSVALVDDCMDSGRSAMAVRQQLIDAGAAKVKIAVIAWGKKEWSILPDQIPPDYYLHRLIHFYPWANNSPHYPALKKWIENKGVALWKS